MSKAKAKKTAKPTKTPDGQQAGHDAAAKENGKLAEPVATSVAPPGTDADRVKELVDKLDCENRRKLHLTGIARKLEKAHKVVDGLKAELKEAKEEAESISKELMREIMDAGSGQGKLPFDAPKKAEQANGHTPDNPPPAVTWIPASAGRKIVDAGAAASLSSLKKWGMTDKKLEAIREAVGGDTIWHLEEAMRKNEWWHREIKGLGDEWITRLQDAHLEFRKVYPMPDPSAVVADAAPEKQTQPAVADEEAPEREVFPITSQHARCWVTVVRQAEEQFTALVTGIVEGGLRIEDAAEEKPAVYPTKHEALIEGLDRLGLWFTQRVPDVGNAVSDEIAFFRAEKEKANSDDKAQVAEFLERIDKLTDALQELGPETEEEIADHEKAESDVDTLQQAVMRALRFTPAQAEKLLALEKQVKKWQGAEVPF